MLSALRASRNSTLISSIRAFSTTRAAAADVAKLTLVGRLVKDPETRLTKNEKEYIAYTVATQSSIQDRGERHYTSTFHRVLCFDPNSMGMVARLKKGSKVYVEADYNIREPEQGADPSTPQGQRHIFLTHDTIKVLYTPKPTSSEATTETAEPSET